MNRCRDDIVISFCIAAYRRQEITTELIREILSVRDDRIEVVVTDNKSGDGSIERYREISDKRFTVIENEKNLGSHLNMCEALDNGTGQFLFYINDRDQVDRYKIKKLIEIFSTLKSKDVTFGMCSAEYPRTEDFIVYNKGVDAILQFACRVTHPTGFFFERDTWRNTERRIFFENQEYGIYSLTMVCALQAREHNGAIILGDICDVNRKRMDFSKNKSRFYENRVNKDLWYSPKTQCNELKILVLFMREYGFDESIIRSCFRSRYKEYLYRTTIGLKDLLKEESNTVHYGIARPHNNFEANIQSCKFYIEMRIRIRSLIKKYCDEEYLGGIREINKKNTDTMLAYLINEILTSIVGRNYQWNKTV